MSLDPNIPLSVTPHRAPNMLQMLLAVEDMRQRQRYGQDAEEDRAVRRDELQFRREQLKATAQANLDEAKQNTETGRQHAFVRAVGSLKARPPEERAARYPALIAELRAADKLPSGPVPETWEEFGGDATIDEFMAQAMPAEQFWDAYGPQKPATKQPLMNLGGGYVFDPETRQVVREPPPEAEISKAETRGLDVQAAEAAARGDTETYNRLLKVKKEMGQADDRPRVTVQTSGSGSGMSPTMEANVINRLTNQWKAASSPAAELYRQSQLMDVGMTAARRGDLAQGSQVVLVTFQKILDPPSVVRESEYMRSAAGQSLVNRVKGYMDQLQKGGAGLRLTELEKFATLAKEAARAQSSGYLASQKERIGKTADRFKLPRDLVFEDFDFNAPTTTTPAGGASGAITYQDYLKLRGGR